MSKWAFDRWWGPTHGTGIYPTWGVELDEHLTISPTKHQQVKGPEREVKTVLAAALDMLARMHSRRCLYCGGRRKLSVDHIRAVALGGADDFGNLAPACRSCNSSKGKKILAAWVAGRPDLSRAEIDQRWAEAKRTGSLPWGGQ